MTTIPVGTDSSAAADLAAVDPVIAGTVGGWRLEYTVVGEAVNVAQRLQSAAEAGEIVAAAPVDPGTGIGLRVVKGHEEPVEVFQLVIA